MTRYMKRILLTAVLLAVVASLAVALGTSAASADPADSYTVQKAPYEDSSLKMWFEHSFNKVLTSDTTPSGMNTYSAYMAKNEVENIQFVLYSATAKSDMTASVSAFTDGKGNEIPAEIFYEMYITVSGIREEFVYGANSSTTPIKEGETPDPVYPLSKVGRTGKFQLNGGKSQAFFIKIRTAEDTPSGWYSAQLDIKNSSGQVVKTATVFCYVWDFVIEEETEFKSAIYLTNDTAYGGTYQAFYDYLLDNRLVGMDVPGGVSSDNEYLTNPRVNSARVTYNGGGNNKGDYGEVGRHVEFANYLDIYNDLSNMEEWEDIKDKFYFYTADEPVGAVWNVVTKALVGVENATVDDVDFIYGVLDNYWESPRSVVPYHENHPYPYFHYTKALSGYADYQLKDSTQAFLEQGGISIWCPQVYAFTPASELRAAGYKGMNGEPVRELSSSISGLYSYGSNNSSTGTVNVDFFPIAGYYDWNKIYGEFDDRIKSEMAIADKNGTVANSELWTYGAGGNYCYTYANHLIENTGLQTKIMFWQFFQNDVEGYLYYAANAWTESSNNNVDNTPTGSFTNTKWMTNKFTYNEDTFYGNGVLFYAQQQCGFAGVTGVIGSLRVEIMRDGVEDYQMLTMLEEYLGEKEAKAVVGKVSTNVVRYLSLPGFNRSAWSSSMDEYDIMASVRRDLGNTLEAAVVDGQCDHTYNKGVVTEEAGCLTAGTKTYTCTKCKAEYYEAIPALHTEGSCFKKVSGTAPTCTQDGNEIYQCTICSAKKTVTTTAFHNDKNYYRYEPHEVNTKAHTIYCTLCNEKVDVKEHTSFDVNTATCTEDGEMVEECRYCGYAKSTGVATQAKGHNTVETTVEATCTEDGYTGTVCKACDYAETTVIPATGHIYENGSCTVCGEAEPLPEYVLGDANGDGEVKTADSLMAKRIAAGIDTPTALQEKALDVNGDDKINSADTNLISRFIAGIIIEFQSSN